MQIPNLPSPKTLLLTEYTFLSLIPFKSNFKMCTYFHKIYHMYEPQIKPKSEYWFFKNISDSLIIIHQQIPCVWFTISVLSYLYSVLLSKVII